MAASSASRLVAAPARVIYATPTYLVSCIITAIIAWGTLSPEPLPDDTPSWFDFPGMDKVVHALMFGALAYSLTIDLSRRRIRRASLYAIIISASLGIAVEFLQKWMGLGRSFEWEDMLADAIGAILLGLLAAWTINRCAKQTSGPVRC